MIDYLIVGSGLFGATCAREIIKRKQTVMIVEKKDHVGGNIHTKEIDGITCHIYGPHIFNTNSDHIWDYVNELTKFRTYKHQVRINNNNKLFSMPINLKTFYQVAGCTSPEQAKKYLESVKLDVNQDSVEGWCLANIGREMYELLIKDYTRKQWNKDPSELPSSIIKRLPVKFSWNDDYYDKKYQGIPDYNDLINSLLDGVKVELGVDFFNIDWKKYANKLIYSGPIDQFFNYCHGKLEYRSLRFENRREEVKDYQGAAQVNHAQHEFTREIEHKHFHPVNVNHTIVTREFPCIGDPYYPINDEKNNELSEKYKKMIPDNVMIGGRLGEYVYINMDQCIASAINKMKKF